VIVRRAVSFAVVAVVVAAAPALAQSPKVEVSGIFEWTFSDGVTGDPVLAGDGNIYDAVDASDSFNWGFMIGVNATDNMEVGFLFGQQQSTLEITGTATREIGDLSINSYHGYFAYNFGPADAPVRPYVLGGFGATNYGGVDFTVGGVSGTTDSSTRFSTTWGGGVKIFPAPRVGVRAGVRWTPTYIKSDAAGWWCDPFWGCYVVGDAQYANQFEMSGGVTLRFD
jgi:opacity protein-like surface antigen